MKLINPSFEILEQGSGLDGIYEAIERAGRTCYKSTRPEGQTAKDFVDRMIASKHYAMLEHGAVYLVFRNYGDAIHDYDHNNLEDKYEENPYSKVVYGPYPKDVKSYEEFQQCYQEVYITTNLRVLVENGWLDDLQYLCEPTEYHEKRVTVRFTADIHFYKDTTRHRVFSWAIESTRFCNYLKEKFGISVSFMKPTWIKEEDIPELEEDCKVIESIYFKWINKGYQAQHAAYFLPQGTKAEVIMTGFVSDYNHFFDLRARGTTGQPHPDVKALAEPLMEEFYKRDLLNKKKRWLFSERRKNSLHLLRD